jgi:orotidine-5'-phosphate decarboxylase
MEIPLKERIIVALDLPSVEEAKELVKRLTPMVRFYKVGLQLFLSGCYQMVNWLAAMDCKIMLDLKLFDVPQTVALAVEQLKTRPVTFITVHGNEAILKAAVEAAEDRLKVLAVTVLTSLDQGDIEDLWFSCKVEDLVLSRAKRALKVGCHGIVSSGLEVARLRREVGYGLIAVTPGIRPIENRPADDQKRVMSPKEAIAAGSDYLVIGRPIRNAKDPKAMVSSLLKEIEEGLKERKA